MNANANMGYCFGYIKYHLNFFVGLSINPDGIAIQT